MGEAATGYVSTTNACKLCTPLGACMVFKGIENCVPYLHGSQGCATYMRRYLISHFREPVDIASSALGEKQAVFGGGPNLKQGILNVARKYDPDLIGIATTCLTETIGDDVASILIELKKEWDTVAPGLPGTIPLTVNVSTPSYQGTHGEGFHAAVFAVVDQLAREKGQGSSGLVNILPGIVSPADLRFLKEAAEGFGLTPVLLPDYSDTLDGPAQSEYTAMAPGGTPVSRIREMGSARATLCMGDTQDPCRTPASLLEERHGVPAKHMGMPVGLRKTDSFFKALTVISGQEIPVRDSSERGRLVDAMVDGHKYLSGKRAVLYGEEDLVAGMASFLAEIGIQPILCASGGQSGRLEEAVGSATTGLVREKVEVEEGVDFYEIAQRAKERRPDLIIGNSKGFKLAEDMGIPLVRIGFPIHDRFGGQRIRHLGYGGALSLYDRIVNALLEVKQNRSNIGYAYL